MFTFVTSSGFQGIDLYDKDAMTIIVSSTSKQWRMVDMMTDLKQAISRQRDKSNPNYGSYIYIYNQSLYTKSNEELLKILSEIRRKIDLNIPHFNNLCFTGESDKVIIDGDVKTYTTKRNGLFELNEQAFNADKYFIAEVRNQYAKGFDMCAAFDCEVIYKPVELPKNVTYRTLVEHFKNSNGNVEWGVYSTRIEWINIIERSYALYKKVWENYSIAKQMVENHGNTTEVVNIEIRSLFKLGARYTKRYITNELQMIYDQYQVTRKAKYYDLQDYYNLSAVKVNGNRFLKLLNK
jgi:hypothetical protein